MNKEIMTGIIIIAIGVIIMAIMGAIGNAYIQKGRTKLAKASKDEILSNQDTLKKISIENNKPLLQVTGTSFGKNDAIDPKYSRYKHKFAFSVTNYGGRPAYKLKASSFFFENTEKGAIGRYNIKGFDENYTEQSILMPNETKSFSYPFTISEEEGLQQLNSTIAMFNLECFDQGTNQSEKFKIYQRFHVEQNKVKVYQAKNDDIDLVNRFLDSLNKESQ